MSPAISLLLVNYNREDYLSTAINSILSQTRADFELLIWDDGSTDNSVTIACEYEQQDDRIRVIAAQHQGVAKARKQAIAETRGNYFGYIDSDGLDCQYSFRKNSKSILFILCFLYSLYF